MAEGTGLEVLKTALALRIAVPLADLHARLGQDVATLGERLAAHAVAIASQERLGYFPALQFFYERPEIPSGLIGAITEAGTFARQHVTREVRDRLRHAFSSIRLQRSQCLAFTLPAVRPSQADALAALARHYTPNVVRVELLVTSLHKGGAAPEGMDKFAAKRARWWLREAFDIEVTDVRVV